MVLHAALAVVLARICACDDISIGTQLSGRGEPALDDVVGMFGNPVVLRVGPRPDEPFARFLERVRETDIAAFDHGEVSFERVADLLRPNRSRAYAPLFQVSLMLQNYQHPVVELPGLRVTAIEHEPDTAELDLTIAFTDIGESGLDCEINYATDIFDRETVNALADRLIGVLTAVGRDASIGVDRLDIPWPIGVPAVAAATY
jgi:non-ribosomal peptide synthetase component F